MTTLEDLYHVGLRVPDLDVAMAELTASLGLTWAPVMERENPAWVPGLGATSYQLRYTYSCEGPVHLELLQGEPGSIWNGDDRNGLHHLGIWTDDVAATTEALIAAGGTLELAGAAPEDGYGRFTYVRTTQGILIEPVARSVKARFEEWWAPGQPATGELTFSEVFHIGIRVSDLQAAAVELTDALGVDWASVQDRPMSVWLPERGAVTEQLQLTYTTQGPMHLELLQGGAGTPWDASTAPGPHHFGVWTDDVPAKVATLVEAGWTIELAAASPEDGIGRLAYVRSPQGVLLEPMSDAAKDRFAAWWAGGELASASR